MQVRERGFTLIEIAIVLVIIGLLLGSVLTGQELIRSARVRNLIAQQDGAKVAFFGFEDRYRAQPGDYAKAGINLNCGLFPCLNGDGNGRIEAPNGANIHEEILAWTHLSVAGFLNGNFTMANGAVSAPDSSNSPANPFGAYMQIAYDGLWGKDSNRSTPNARSSVKTGNQIPVEMLNEVDRKIDDGRPYAGSFQFSTYSGTGTAPDVGGTSPNACTTADADTADWNIKGGQSNCGAASLL